MFELLALTLAAGKSASAATQSAAIREQSRRDSQRCDIAVNPLTDLGLRQVPMWLINGIQAVGGSQTPYLAGPGRRQRREAHGARNQLSWAQARSTSATIPATAAVAAEDEAERQVDDREHEDQRQRQQAARGRLLDQDAPDALDRAEPRLLLISFVVVAAGWVPQSLNALWLKFVANGVVLGQDVQLAVGIGGLAASAAFGWLLTTAGGRVVILFSARVTIAVEAHVARLQATTVRLEHHERPEHLDRLQVLRDQTHRLENIYRTFFNLVGAAARLAITVGLLVSVHPVLALLLVFAFPAAATSTLRQAAVRRSMQRAAPYTRLARHLFNLCTTPGPGKEIRVTRVGRRLAERRRRTWLTGFRLVAAARWRNTALQAATWALFGAAYLGAIVFVAVGLHASPGAVVLVVGTGALSTYISSALG